MLRRDDDSVWLSSRAASLPKSLIAVEPHERGVLLPRRGPPSPRTALSPQSSARSLRSLVLVPRLAEGLGDLLRETAGGPGTRRTVARHPVLRRELGRRGESRTAAEDASDRPTDPRPREERGSCADVFRACRPPLPPSDVLFCNSLPLMLILFYLA